MTFLRRGHVYSRGCNICALWLEPADETLSPHGPIRRLLLATDGSADAAAAEEVFTALAPAAEQVIAMSVVTASDPVARAREQTDTVAHLADLVERIPRLETLVAEGHTSARIKALAREYDVDLVVLGRRGAGRLTAVPLGSTAEAVCRRSERPVLLVPPPDRGSGATG